MPRHLASLPLLLVVLAPAVARDELPLAVEVDRPAFRAHATKLLTVLREVGIPLPDATERAVRAALQEDTAEAIDRVQELLDAHCLIGVNINPESRVKAARGPAGAELTLGKVRWVLVKVDNQAGVTHPLRVGGPGVREEKVDGAGRWLTAAVRPVEAGRKGLDGQRLEYLLLRLEPHEPGKREATLRFDVGQGTQDLGFRAEVPVLFTVHRPPR